MRTGYVYLIGQKSGGPVKIGHAVNVRQRLATLQVGCWEELSILHTVTVPWTIAAAAEKALHESFAKQRIRGEWFAIPEAVAKQRMDRYAEEMVIRRSEGDWFSKEVCFALCKQPLKAGMAVTSYRNACLDHRRKPFIKGVNRRLMDEAGQAAYVIFQMVFVENRDLTDRFKNQSRLARQAEASLVEALDVLAGFWDQACAHDRLLDSLGRNAA